MILLSNTRTCDSPALLNNSWLEQPHTEKRKPLGRLFCLVIVIHIHLLLPPHTVDSVFTFAVLCVYLTSTALCFFLLLLFFCSFSHWLLCFPHWLLCVSCSLFLTLTVLCFWHWQFHVSHFDNSTFLTLTVPRFSHWQFCVSDTDSFTFLTLAVLCFWHRQFHVSHFDSSVFLTLTVNLCFSRWQLCADSQVT